MLRTCKACSRLEARAGTRREKRAYAADAEHGSVVNFIVIKGTCESNSFCRLDLRRRIIFLANFSPDRE